MAELGRPEDATWTLPSHHAEEVYSNLLRIDVNSLGVVTIDPGTASSLQHGHV